MQGFAEAFIRNSDRYVTLDRKKRKEAAKDKDTASSKQGEEKEKMDPKFVNTVMMMSCIVLSFPYDLPSYMPLLVSSLVRHAPASSLIKDIISHTVLEFKRTHQDRWDEYKAAFSRDQLDSLVSASQVSYFS